MLSVPANKLPTFAEMIMSYIYYFKFISFAFIACKQASCFCGNDNVHPFLFCDTWMCCFFFSFLGYTVLWIGMIIFSSFFFFWSLLHYFIIGRGKTLTSKALMDWIFRTCLLAGQYLNFTLFAWLGLMIFVFAACLGFILFISFWLTRFLMMLLCISVCTSEFAHLLASHWKQKKCTWYGDMFLLPLFVLANWLLMAWFHVNSCLIFVYLYAIITTLCRSYNATLYDILYLLFFPYICCEDFIQLRSMVIITVSCYVLTIKKFHVKGLKWLSNEYYGHGSYDNLGFPCLMCISSCKFDYHQNTIIWIKKVVSTCNDALRIGIDILLY